MKYITKVNNLNDYKLNPIYPMVCKLGNNIYYRKKYTKLEYISSTQTGGQYIDLGCKLMENTDDIRIDIKFNIKDRGLNSSNQQGTLICSQPEVSPYPGFTLRYIETNSNRIELIAKWKFTTCYWRDNRGRSKYLYYYGHEILDNNIYEFTEILDNIPESQINNFNCHLFCALNSSNEPFRFIEADLYYLRFTKGDVIIKDLIPVKDANGNIGLYDNITDKFYMSLGDAPFVAGPEKLNKKYNILDILYTNKFNEKIVTSKILHPKFGFTPIGLCVAGTDFFGLGEKARFMSLKYMNYETPETGSLTAQGVCWGNSGTDLNTIPNIQTTYNGGSNNGYFNVDYYDSSSQSNKIPSMFDENNEWNTLLGAANQYAVTDIQGREKTDLILASAISQSTWMTDTSITNESGEGYAPAACCCARYHTLGTQPGDWYLGASGEMCMIIVQKTAINTKLAQIAAVYSTDSISSLVSSTYWSSSEYNSGSTYYFDANFGYIGTFSKYNNYRVVAMLAY